jgi:hypothetical protein
MTCASISRNGACVFGAYRLARLSWHGYFGRDADSGVEQVRCYLAVGLGVRPCLDGIFLVRVRRTSAAFLEKEKPTVSLHKCVSDWFLVLERRNKVKARRESRLLCIVTTNSFLHRRPESRMVSLKRLPMSPKALCTSNKVEVVR